MKIRLPLVVFTIIAICFVSAYAQQNKPTYRISLTIKSTDPIETEFFSYISRELRSLDDIVIVESKSDLMMSVIVSVDKTSSGRDIGYSAAVLVTEQTLSPFFISLVTTKCTDNRIGSQIPNVLQFGKSVLLFSLLSDNDLKSMCQRIVASVDANVIEEKRKFHQIEADAINSVNIKPITPTKMRTTKKP